MAEERNDGRTALGKFAEGNTISKKYKPEYAQQMIDYFENHPDFPTFPGFYARTLGIVRTTAYKWRDEHKEFGEAWDICRGIQEDLLTRGALTGKLNATFAAKVAACQFDMVEKSQVEIGGKDGEEISISINIDHGEEKK